MMITSIKVRTEARAAFEALEGERLYQNEKWDPNSTESGGVHNVVEWIVYIEDYIDEAKRILSRHTEPQATVKALHAIRKVGAMAVACMEQNGVHTRAEEGKRPVGYREA